MKIIVGLGNPGSRYEKTRHSAGRIVLGWLEKTLAQQKKVRLVLLDDFMNNSGAALKKYSAKNKLKYKTGDLLVVHDDLDIELGRAKLTFGRSSGGHKGVESVIRAVKTKNFWRLRIGVLPRRKIQNTKDYLLSDFSDAEQKLISKQKKKIIDVVELWLQSPTGAQNFINQK